MSRRAPRWSPEEDAVCTELTKGGVPFGGYAPLIAAFRERVPDSERSDSAIKERLKLKKPPPPYEQVPENVTAMPSPRESSLTEAVAIVAEALEDLQQEERLRVLRAVSVLFDLEGTWP